MLHENNLYMVDPLTTSAISWGFSAANWLISPILTRFLNKCFDALDVDLQFQSQKKILLVKLEKLKTMLLPQLLILTDAAQQSPHRPFLDKWLQKLKSAFYEAEDVLAIVEYQQLEKEVNSLFPSTSKSILKKLKCKFSSEAKNLIKSLENLEKIVNEAMEFVPLLNLPSSSGNSSTLSSNEQYRETISTSGSTVIGRVKDRDHIVKLLRENFSESTSNGKSYSVIGIWGMGGTGKTTLAQFVCEHEKQAKYFEYIMWVYVSEKFNFHAIMRNMWESVSGSSYPSYENLDLLTSQLAEKLRGKKYLLVLDDVWCEKGVSEQELNQLFAPLKGGKSGSKILVTTRNEEAARVLGAMDLMKLPELAHEDFLSLFMNHALTGVKVTENLEKKLRAIGEKIVEKLCHLPLAATTVAGQLRRRVDPEFWSSMLNKSLLKNTTGALFLSYQHLPPPLQRCFAFCNLFPKGHLFKHDHLVNLWIAEGFIETEQSNEHMKDIGDRYILELISSSFFQVGHNRDGKYYYMHDLIHDLAQDVSEGEYFRIESGKEKEIPVHTRHIYVTSHMLGEYVEKICKLKDLRTIISQGELSVASHMLGDYLKEGDLNDLFKKLRKLCVVEMTWLNVKRVPKSVVQLRNLRYLNFKYSNIDAHFISQCYQLRFLSIENLIPNVGRLISLQELGRSFDVRMERGFELKQLEHLKDLYGSLSISGLNNVKSKEEADRAKLSHKKGLHGLVFLWDDESVDVLRDNDVEILDGLCPPPQIKELTIYGYSGKRFSNWISENNENVIHLQLLNLFGCDGLEVLHKINELSDLLSLTICSLPRLKSWVPLPLNLTQLAISSCLSLVFAVKKDLEMIMSTTGTRISQIVNFKEMMNDCMEDACCRVRYEVLSIDYNFNVVLEMMKYGDDIEEETLLTISEDLNKCLEKRLDLICQLKDVYGEPFLPPTLERLYIQFCFITNKLLAGSLQGLTSLTHLSLKDIITITCIPKEALSSLTNLLDLYIERCLLLTSIGGLDTHSTLENLVICICPNLTTFETSFVVASYRDTIELTSSSRGRRTRSSSTLKCVKLRGCMLSDDMLQGLISPEILFVLSDIPTIENPHIGDFKPLMSALKLENCPNLVSLRGLNELTNLERLEVVSGCDKLECYSDGDKLPQLKELRIYRFSLLEQLVSRDGFSSLVTLELDGVQQEYFSEEECDEMFRYLSSLTEIRFEYCKMRSLPNMMCLHSLLHLKIWGCKNLTSLPDVPPSVERIYINYCDEEFTRSCKDPNHPNWHKISHIPQKIIY